MSTTALALPHLGPHARSLLDRIVAGGQHGLLRDQADERVLVRLLQLGYVEQHPLDSAAVVPTQAGLRRWRVEVLAEEQRAAERLRKQLIRQRLESRGPAYALVPAGSPAPVRMPSGASTGPAIVALPALAGPSAPGEWTGPGARRSRAQALAAMLLAATGLAALVLASLGPFTPQSFDPTSRQADAAAAPPLQPQAQRTHVAIAIPPQPVHRLTDISARATRKPEPATVPRGTGPSRPGEAPGAATQLAATRPPGIKPEASPGQSDLAPSRHDGTRRSSANHHAEPVVFAEPEQQTQTPRAMALERSRQAAYGDPGPSASQAPPSPPKPAVHTADASDSSDSSVSWPGSARPPASLPRVPQQDVAKPGHDINASELRAAGIVSSAQRRVAVARHAQGNPQGKASTTRPARRIASAAIPATGHGKASHSVGATRPVPHASLSGRAEVEWLNTQSLAAAKEGREWRPAPPKKG